MKKIAEKVVLVAQICITLVFVLTTILYVAGVLSCANAVGTVADNSVTIILLIVLAVVYLGLSAYMIYVNFSERENLKKILLFSDCDSSTRTNIKVLKNVVKGCSNQVEGISVRKLRVRTDEKGGLIAIFNVRVAADDIAQSIDKLRTLLIDSFESTFGLTFNSVNFEIDKLKGRYKPENKDEKTPTDEQQVEVEQPAATLMEPAEEIAKPQVETEKQTEEVDEVEKEKV